MKLKREPLDIDLYVVHANPTEKDLKEMAEFVENHKRKQEIKAKRLLARKKKKVKKYEVVETNMAFAREPEPDLYKDKKKRKLAAKRKPAHKKTRKIT